METKEMLFIIRQKYEEKASREYFLFPFQLFLTLFESLCFDVLVNIFSLWSLRPPASLLLN